jgi:hypothetical protein
MALSRSHDPAPRSSDDSINMISRQKAHTTATKRLPCARRSGRTVVIHAWDAAVDDAESMRGTESIANDLIFSLGHEIALFFNLIVSPPP